MKKTQAQKSIHHFKIPFKWHSGKKQNDKERNQINIPRGLQSGEETDYKGTTGTFGMREIFSILIVVVVTQLYAFVKIQMVHQNGWILL